MHRTISIWLLVVVCAVVLVAFFWMNGKLTKNAEELDAEYSTSQARLTRLQAEQSELQSTLETVGTDAFIENQARTMYGYMMPDEVRFVITNPEALYGEEEIPSR